jgi:hypothetical protein
MLLGLIACIVQVSERDAAESARKAARQSAADRIYDKLRLEKEAALRAQVRDGQHMSGVKAVYPRRFLSDAGVVRASTVTGIQPKLMLTLSCMLLHCVQEEEEYLIDLMRDEEAAEKRRQDAAREAASREASKQVCLRPEQHSPGSNMLTHAAAITPGTVLFAQRPCIHRGDDQDSHAGTMEQERAVLT